MAITARPRFTSAQVTGFYFQPCRDDFDEIILEYFRCRCGTVRKQTRRNGRANLMQHVRHEHHNFEAEMLEATTSETGSLLSYVSRSSQNLYGWLMWVVTSNLPLTFCENRATRRYTTLEKAVLQPFAASAAAAPESDDEESSSFVERLQKRRKPAQQEQKYVLIRSIPPTSNIVERFF
ncbi:hypothetical protein F444_13698 [Phytophthora nicotianae P1976]|uniref:BED-type domain-containing protein n=1 Tax=Phytophthora nicotianae P1976 TaxID=1317066 RepID=A0A080ZT01_PHYNI|nr:hypothetical protein F444_13698 [Phytophthora nicotianae P1976]